MSETAARAPDLSIVSTLYLSERTVEEFVERAVAAGEQAGLSFEVILVNDGSPDRSLEIVRGLLEKEPRLRIVDLARNFGHHRALLAGLDAARGMEIFLLDSDLEEDPAWLADFRRERNRVGADVVFGAQRRRKGGWFEQVSGWLFFRAFNLLSEWPLPTNLCTVRLMSRRYLDAFLEHRERETVIAGLWVLTGFLQVAVPVDKVSRGRSVYSVARRIGILVDAITSFSARPLEAIFYLGTAILVIAGVYAAQLVARKLLFGINATGWASLIVSVWLLGGLTIFCLGVLGIYLSKVFLETKKRPAYLVRQVYEAGRAGTEPDRPRSPHP